MKKAKIFYWTSTIIFAFLMFMDGIGGITRQEAGVEIMKHLGYPIYFLSIVGTAKILGAMAIVQNKFKAIKEWAYAGFVINFIGAFASRAFMGDSTFETVFPLIALAITFIPYFAWKKYEQVHLVPSSVG
ncbi:MAG: hypothetical protein DHS20C18_14090 [Saprospiraceae bacterium]|nr:MAG: hypothetical protein DHS20C18_14090 [Saprospiraceae bacterium]